MDFIKEWGSIAGFAGLALGAFVFLFRNVLKKKIFSKLSPRQSFTFLLLFMVLVVGVSVFSIKTYYDNEAIDNGQLTILVHGEGGKADLVLPNRGEVKLIYGDAIIVEKINAKGEANFKQIPGSFFEDGASVEIVFSDPEGEPYHAVKGDSTYQLTLGQYIPLEVELTGIAALKGVVRDFESGAFLDSVRISILGAETFSNAYGEYHLDIPGDLQKKFQTIRAFKEGYVPFEMTDVPVQTDSEFPITLKPAI